jgi:poly-gamma-glutamate synthesis protein (capsule biosynthesis protein)
VYQYMTEIAHGAIDAGADLVIGHGPHYSLPVELYRGKPIFYGLGSFSFHTGHGGRKHGDWVGMMVRAELDAGALRSAGFQFVRHNDANETVPCALQAERETFETIEKRSLLHGAKLFARGDEAMVDLAE